MATARSPKIAECYTAAQISLLIQINHSSRCISRMQYPMGLSRDDIIFKLRIITVADVVEAIPAHRRLASRAGPEKGNGRGPERQRHFIRRRGGRCLHQGHPHMQISRRGFVARERGSAATTGDRAPTLRLSRRPRDAPSPRQRRAADANDQRAAWVLYDAEGRYPGPRTHGLIRPFDERNWATTAKWFPIGCRISRSHWPNVPSSTPSLPAAATIDRPRLRRLARNRSPTV